MAESILLVDDNRLSRRNVAGFLSRFGYKVTQAENGEDAIQIIRDINHFDVVITDLRMPGSVNGLDVLEYQIAVSPGKCGILVTAFGSDHIRKHVHELGASYMDKPIRLTELLEEIRKRQSP
jgi:CheY-like chemotaxis protein